MNYNPIYRMFYRYKSRWKSFHCSLWRIYWLLQNVSTFGTKIY